MGRVRDSRFVLLVTLGVMTFLRRATGDVHLSGSSCRSSGCRGSRPAEAVAVCRWNAYLGQPLLIDELLFRTQHGLIDQSLHSRMGAETTNGDGFGLGWYTAGKEDEPGRYRSVEPAWNDANLRDLAGHIESPLFLAHIRAAVGQPGAADKLPPVPARPLAVRPQRPPARLPRDAPRTDARDRAVALRWHRGFDRLRSALLPGAHIRARGGPTRSGRARGRVRRGNRREARHRATRCR